MIWLRYVPHGRMLEFLRKGWTFDGGDELHGTSHGEYAVLLRWGGDGEPE